MRAPVPLDDNNVRILKKTVIAKRNTRATAAAAKKRVTQKGKKSVPQLGEQAKQSLAPLKVFSDDDIVDENGMVRGTNIEDYLPDNVQFESLEEVGTYQYGHPLVNPGTPLTTMMRRLHTWYLDCCKLGGADSIFVVVKKNQDDLVAIDLFPVPFEELFQLYNAMVINKVIVTSYCL